MQALSAGPAAQQNPLLEIQTLSDSLKGLSAEQKLANVRLFLKSSGENWEDVQNCGGTGRLDNDWYSRLRASDLARQPRSPEEAVALKLARQALEAAATGNLALQQELVGQIRKMNSVLMSCGLDYSSITPEIMEVLIKARGAIGSELRQLFLNGDRLYRRMVFNNLVACQMNFAEGIDANLNCYLKLMPESAPNKEHALSVVKEAAILTLLMERNQNPPCYKVPVLSEKEKEDYELGTLMSPIFNRNKEINFDIENYVCALKKEINWSKPK